ncbi:MAG: glucose-6-phosphate isomerase [Bacteroides sp.]|nr:glucose-6-phosphate isomerase [Ruminococcus flavefaciens]MCM1554345.1 glucose-6-phosphate isomerase [Bacteroides sp.]
MESLRLDFTYGLDAGKTLQSLAERKDADTPALKDRIEKAYRTLLDGNGAGNGFLGWIRLPEQIRAEELDTMIAKAEDFKQKSQLFVCIGIGGSYLGTRAIIEALKPQLADRMPGCPAVIYAGHQLGQDYMNELLSLLDSHDYTLCVISKSGTTTEPAIAFRLLRNHLEKKYGKEEARQRIVAITDRTKGALRTLATEEGYTTYVVPDDIGGRYSVLSPVGLFPLAVAGIDIKALVKGAAQMQERLISDTIDWTGNIAAQYALFRQMQYVGNGKKVELLVNFEPRFYYLSEWWKQLYGESEGKQGKGLFPSNAGFTTDLHSLGQYIQDGERLFFESVLSLDRQHTRISIPQDGRNLDGMNFVAGKEMAFVNQKAEEGTLMAHSGQGNVPVLRICVPELNERYLGQLIYFFEFACGLSGYSMDVNPFDQPGVEAYKQNMFQLLGK